MEIIPQLILNSLIAGAVYTLMAIGFSLSFATSKFFNLSHGVLAAFGGFIFYFLLASLHINPFLSCVLAIIAAGFLAFAADKLIFSRLRKKEASNMVLLVATLGVFIAIEAILALLFTSQYRSLRGLVPIAHTFSIGGGVITLVQLITLIMSLFITFGLSAWLNKTNTGKVIKALSDDEEVAKIIGINTERIISWVFFIAGAVAGLAGVLVSLDTGIEPTMGLNLLFKGVIAAIVGGVGNIYGAAIGGLLLGFVENFGIWKISGEWKDTIAFALLILFLLFRPGGIFKK